MASEKTVFIPKRNHAAKTSAEHLLLVQYRYWMTGHATRKTCYWDRAWEVLRGTLETEKAKALFADLHVFTRLLREQAVRDLSWHPSPCQCPCHDESLVLSLIHASQCAEEFTEILAASELLGTHRVDCLVEASRATAKGLKSCGFILQSGEVLPHSPPSQRPVLH
ncbi:hypothetical protein [Beijerinckia indica]|uniref:Uncharacterized protein n=1 Tax=Beijerinckia indica subsp. indica (strain ATCC 9039 / DSM 1715 / NCIMB 8712) TaxID=395963 RepID=B2IK85_BEII9|nr:hypothetical protein [Beijerinckia indica]ACB95017.1 hypothetical protein Bind_1377 [Beijerinckia indica subsp. indica ATCC 9039]